ncbi:MAG: hypothetical protein JST06_09140, partial [Bacteroidetes bacterium]|nr:hypothetical protein [Bacteroidota bacterium]
MISLNIGMALAGQVLIQLLDDESQIPSLSFDTTEESYLREAFGREQFAVFINRYAERHYVVLTKQKSTDTAHREALRKAGAEAGLWLKSIKATQAGIVSHSVRPDAAFHFGQGLMLGAYQFLKYR